MAVLRDWAVTPWFWLGLGLRLLLVTLCVQLAADNWYVPFFETTFGATLHDPWQVWAAAGGRPEAFPYGYVMWLAFMPLYAVQSLLTFDGAWFYFKTLLIFELILFFFLVKLTGEKRHLIASLYWLSPIALFPAYAYGFNDIVPVAMLMATVYALSIRYWKTAGLLLALAVSCKLSMVVAVPIFLLYFINKASVRYALPMVAASFALTLALFNIPFIMSPRAIGFVMLNPEMGKLGSYALLLGDAELILPPLAYVLFLYWIWRARRISFNMAVAFLGVTFLALALLTPQAPGWFVWSLPFLVLYQLQSNRIAIPLVQLYSALFVLAAILQAPIMLTNGLSLDLAAWLAKAALPETLLQNATVTLLVTLGMILGLRMWRESISQNAFFRITRRPFMLGVAGDSGAGKDTYANALVDVFGAHSAMNLSGDDYHKYDRGRAVWDMQTHLNPAANNLEDFTADIRRLRAGQTVLKRHYDHGSGKLSRPIKERARDFVIVSGLHAFFSPRQQALYDMRVFLDIDEKLRRHFKIGRDTLERGKGLDETLAAIERRRPDYKRFVEPQRAHADLVLSLLPETELPEAYQPTDMTYALRAQFAAGSNEESFIRFLVGVLGVAVYDESDYEKGQINIVISGDLSADDVALAVESLCADMLELFDEAPVWHGGMTGVMQLVSLMIADSKMSARSQNENTL
jgi:uridine kinase